MSRKVKIAAVKAYSRGSLRLKIEIDAGYMGPSVKLSSGFEILIQEARELASDLTRLADEAQSKIDKERASEERRKKWREREIAAGRIIIVGAPRQ